MLRSEHQHEIGRITSDLEDETCSRYDMDKRLADMRKEVGIQWTYMVYLTQLLHIVPTAQVMGIPQIIMTSHNKLVRHHCQYFVNKVHYVKQDSLGWINSFHLLDLLKKLYVLQCSTRYWANISVYCKLQTTLFHTIWKDFTFTKIGPCEIVHSIQVEYMNILE